MANMFEPSMFQVLMPPITTADPFWTLVSKTPTDLLPQREPEAVPIPLRPKLPPEIKRLWLAALRSGKYHQVRGVLRNSEFGFCAMGLLHHVANDAHHEKWLTPQETCDVVHQNDAGIPFPVLANWIEARIEARL
jgi:hypothetical protein